MTELEIQGENAKAAARILATIGTARKNAALSKIAAAILEDQDEWLRANSLDIANAQKNGMSEAMLDRLLITPERIKDISRGVTDIIALPDPIATIDEGTIRPNGLKIIKKRAPLGVIAIIYEARPNVTVDAATLCLKSGNACILRGGREAINSNRAAVGIMRKALSEAGLPEDAISLVQDTRRETADELMRLAEYVDVLIPRGGAGLIRSVVKNALVPVIRTGEGICHIYVDKDADLTMAANVLYNAKCSRPSVCNAVECVLIHREVLKDFLKEALPLLSRKKVELRCDEETLDAIREPSNLLSVSRKHRCDGETLDATGAMSQSENISEKIYEGAILPAKTDDWDSEYDDYILAVKVVGDAKEAIHFITEHGTAHSEAIITENYTTAQYFLDQVDAAAVYVNASTRFTDGGEFGLGAEIGISTQKLHARGPMGLKELTSIKYQIYGDGQVR